MPTRRRYTKREKVTAVIAADMSSAAAAARKLRIPERNIQRWQDDPEMAPYVAKTREDLAEESRVIAHMALAEIRKRIADFEPPALVTLYGVTTDKTLLLTGEATSRSEHTELPAPFDDEEKRALREAINGALDAQKADP
jgi:hypothetical protein